VKHRRGFVLQVTWTRWIHGRTQKRPTECKQKSRPKIRTAFDLFYL
jgi:hypothetical protein